MTPDIHGVVITVTLTILDSFLLLHSLLSLLTLSLA